MNTPVLDYGGIKKNYSNSENKYISSWNTQEADAGNGDHEIFFRAIDKSGNEKRTQLNLTVFNEGAPHPRTYGTFARVLGRYVRERNILTLEEAIRKMTSLPASVLSIKKRGLIKEGYFADITIFDSNRIIDKATFENPHQYAIGVNFVLVNGIIVVENGIHNGKRPGRILYGPGYRGNK